MPRRSQIEAWKAETRHDETAREEIILSSVQNVKRYRIPTTTFRRRVEIEKRRDEFVRFVQPRLSTPKIVMSKLLVNGKDAVIGFIALDSKNEHSKIVRSYFFGPKGY